MSEIILKIENLRKEYGEVVPIKNINLEVQRGEIISIIGGSGTGKSTFLRMLNLLERPTAGKILFGGENIVDENCNLKLIRQKIGMIFQSFNLFAGMTVIENAIAAPMELKGISAQAAYDKAKKLFEAVGLVDKIFNYPDELSGGQQQRAAIVRAMMMEPEILLFDEPTSALDPAMVGEVLAVIRMLAKQNLTMLIVTHEMNFAREVADRVLFFADGEIYEQGTPTQIFDAPKLPKTVAFIRRQKFFNYEISTRHFDLPAMQSKIIIFADKYGLGQKISQRLQLCCEEIIFEMMQGSYNDSDKIFMTVEIIYTETEKILELNLNCGGKSYNPFDEKIFGLNADDFSLKILYGYAKNFSWLYSDGTNKIHMEIVVG
jgi:polar amino acid transport system ATP-binding protein